MAVTEGYARTPSIVSASGCTAKSVPVKPVCRRLCRISDPIRPRPRFAPITATVVGSKNQRMEAAAACCDRCAARSVNACDTSSFSVT